MRNAWYCCRTRATKEGESIWVFFCKGKLKEGLSDIEGYFKRKDLVGILVHDQESMEKEVKNQRGCRAPERDFLLQWGNRKRLRCVKVREAAGGGGGVEKPEGQKRITSRVNRRVIRVEKESSSRSPPEQDLIHSNRKSESGASENRKSHASSPEKEDRLYTTRGSLVEENGSGKGSGEGVVGGENKGMVLPRFFVSLSSKQKEEDFMAMKGCKLPQRPKKRAKFIQKTIFLVSPGAWLSDLSQERYEVREKKSSRKRRRGLKAMCMESDSERD